MDMKIDETGREIVSVKIDNLFRSRICLLANCRNFPLCHDNLEPIANSVGKNQTRINEYHVLVGRDSVESTKCARKIRHGSEPWPAGTDCVSDWQRPFFRLRWILNTTS
jgi:hypothetical protein